jgi:peptide/nickel transport system substrate-binding protein
MKRLRWQILIVILALAAIGILLISRQQMEENPPAESATQAAAPLPVSGGVYTEALIGEAGRLNPVLDFHNSPDRDVNRLLYSSLIRFDDRGLPVADLAESWASSLDGTIYNFSIKPGAVWHDGAPVTSADVAFTVSLLQSENLPIPADLRAFWQEVQVDASDPDFVQFTLPEPFAPFLDYATFGILPQHLLGGLAPEELVDAPFNLQPIGSGPYRFSRWLGEGEAITGVALGAFDDYYGGRAFIDQVVFQYYATPAEALAAYQSGAVMGISEITPEIFGAALAESDLSLYTARLPQMTLILFNLDTAAAPFLQERDVRRALMLALNRQRMVDTLLNGQGIVANSPIFPGTWAYFDGVHPVDYDPDAAVELLRALDYVIPAEGGAAREKEGVALSFTLLHPAGERYALLAQTIQQSWAMIGVAVELAAVDYDTLIENRLATHAYTAALVDLSLFRSPDPDPYPFWHQAQADKGQNYSQWDDRPASEYLEQARVTQDLAERTRLYRNFQVRFMQELPALPLFYPTYTYGVDAQVQGFSLGPIFDASDRFAAFRLWFIGAGE